MHDNAPCVFVHDIALADGTAIRFAGRQNCLRHACLRFAHKWAVIQLSSVKLGMQLK